jgi:hypothetical protein
MFSAGGGGELAGRVPDRWVFEQTAFAEPAQESELGEIRVARPLDEHLQFSVVLGPLVTQHGSLPSPGAACAPSEPGALGRGARFRRLVERLERVGEDGLSDDRHRQRGE